MLHGVVFSCQQIGVNTFYKCIEFQVNCFDSYWEIKLCLKNIPNFYVLHLYIETRADNSGYANHRIICLTVFVSLLIVNKYSKFQMDTFDSFWEMDSDKKLNRKLNRPRRWHRSDDNSPTFFLRKVELKRWSTLLAPVIKHRQKIFTFVPSLVYFDKLLSNFYENNM